jgi:hypothetical protein
VAAGAAIASAQLAATFELSRHSLRDGGVGGFFANIGAMPPQELVGFALPFAFGFDRPADVAETYYHRGSGYWGAGVNSWEMCVYVGVPVLVLAMAGARRSRFWMGVAILGAALMLGGPLWALVRLLPGFGYFRFPARFAIWSVAGLAVLAAYGADELRRRANVRGVRALCLWTLALFTLSTAVVRLGLDTRRAELQQGLTAYFSRQVELPPPPAALSPLAMAALPAPEPEAAALIPRKVARILADLRQSSDPLSRRVWWPAGLLLLTALLLRRPRLLTALVALDLLTFGTDYHPTRPADEVATEPAWLAPAMRELGGWRTTVLDRRMPVTFEDDLLPASMGLPLGTSDVILPSPLLLVRNDALLAAGGLDVGDKGAVKARRWLAHPGISRRLAVRWIATVHELPGLIPMVRGRYNVWEDPQALPRARVVPCVAAAADAESAFASVLAEEPTRTVVLEGGETGCASGEGAAAAVVSYADERVEIAASGPGTLVLADTAYPGWHARLDGAEVPILTADLVVRGVWLPAGPHTVVFTYEPGGLRWLLLGGALALLGALAVPATALLAGIRGQRG